MGIKQQDISIFLKSDCQGFIYDTTRSFLARHSSPQSLYNQLQSLYAQGDTQACKDLIQLIFEERHPLSSKSELMVLRAQIAFEENDNTSEAISWVKQAQINNKTCGQVELFLQLLQGQSLLKDGLYKEGEQILTQLLESGYEAHAAYLLGHHFFWKGHNTEKGVALLKIAIDNRPGYIKAWATLGFAYNKLDLKEKSQHAFSQCLEYETNPEKVAFYKQQLAS